jgi:two-component system cell cycle sensor histidine kinase/response regulator CckA
MANSTEPSGPFLALAGTTDELVFVWKHTGEMLWVNAAFTRETGLSLADFGFRNEDNPFVHPEDLPSVLEKMAAFLASSDRVSPPIDNRFYDAWRAVRGLRSIVHKVDWNGEPALLLVSKLRDDAGGAAAPAESIWRRGFRDVFDATSDALLVHAEDGRILDANDRAVQLYGITRNRLIGGTVGVISLGEPPYTEREAAELVRRAIEEGPQTFEWRGRRGDGTAFWCEVGLRASIAGGERRVIASVRDIEQRKVYERELAASEERFRTLAEAATEGVMIHADGVVLAANEAIARMVGLASPVELVGKRGLAVMGLTPDSKSAILEHMRLGSSESHEIEVVRPDGSRIAAETHAREIQYGGRGARLVSMLDITERKAALEERQRLEASLAQAQKMESVGRLAGGIAHDFNNLLTVIIGDAQLALERLPAGESHELLAEILRAGESAATLTRQLLAFSRKQVIEPRTIDLTVALPRLQSMLERILGEDIALRVVLAPGLSTVRMDPGQLEQVILNLAVNSRDAMPGGGRLTIEAENVALDEAYCRDHPQSRPGPFVRLVVTDNGLGMSDEVKFHLFEPFFTTKARGHGTGLGLPMVYGAVTQNGGSIDVYSEPGHGTSFEIYLPRVGHAADPTAPRPHLAAGGQGETIFLVEDHEFVRAFALRVLVAHGYDVHAFASGPEALDAIPGLPQPPRLLVTDVVMPGMNGDVLAERMRAAVPALEVLFTSGYTANVIAHHGVLAEGIEYLAKPYAAEDLLRRVREVLHAAAPR